MIWGIIGVLLLAFAVFIALFPYETVKEQTQKVLAGDILEAMEASDVAPDEVSVGEAVLLRFATLVASALLFVLLLVLYGLLPAGVAIILALFVFRTTRGTVRKIAEARRREIAREFPLFLSQFAVLMRVSDVYRAIDATASGLDGPLGKEVKRLREEMKYLPIRAALRNFARRLKFEPADRFASTLIYSMSTGADVVPILEANAEQTYTEHVNAIKRSVRTQPIWLSFLPVGISFLILIILVFPMFMDIITKMEF